MKNSEEMMLHFRKNKSPGLEVMKLNSSESLWIFGVLKEACWQLKAWTFHEVVELLTHTEDVYIWSQVMFHINVQPLGLDVL